MIGVGHNPGQFCNGVGGTNKERKKTCNFSIKNVLALKQIQHSAEMWRGLVMIGNIFSNGLGRPKK